MAIVSEVIRFILPRSSASQSAFRSLRKVVAAKGDVTVQQFGYLMQNEGFPRPKPRDQMCWYIGEFFDSVALLHMRGWIIR